jgi:hypothetical protein
MSIHDLVGNHIHQCFRLKTGAFLLASYGLLMAQSAQADEWTYTARKGDTLIGLAETYTKQADYWRGMQALNHIADPTRIPPGTKIRIPVNWLKFEAAPVRIIQVHGEAEVVPSNGGAAQPALVGMELHNGDQVRTGAKSTINLAFADGSNLLVRSQSRLALDSLSIFRKGMMVDVSVRLEQGDVDSKITPAPAGVAPHFRIITPSAVAAVRGTQFRVHANPEEQNTARNETLEGKVEVGKGGHQSIVPAGFGVVADASQGPSEPRKLLSAPDLSGLPKVVETFSAEFAWPQKQGETAYQIQVAPDAGFSSLLADQRSTAPNTAIDGLPDGNYQLRIRAVDAVGLEGFDAVHTFTLNARPEAPHALAPIDDSALVTARPKLWWAMPPLAIRYHLQLSSHSDFAEVLRDVPSLSNNSWEADRDLPPGHYFWRVATIDEQGEQGPYGKHHAFTLQKPPKAP